MSNLVPDTFARLPIAHGINAVGRPMHDIRMKPVFEYRASAARETVDKPQAALIAYQFCIATP